MNAESIDITDSVKALSFDLDDTLWPLMPTILAAEKAQKEWLKANAPLVFKNYQVETVEAIRDAIFEEGHARVADVTWFRLELLRRLCAVSGVSDEGADCVVQGAFGVFLKHRRSVQFYDDSLQALQQLAGRFRLIAITNGNADIFSTAAADLFEFSLSPVDEAVNGIAKPAKEIFSAAVERLELSPHEILHIGDCLNADVAGANGAGMKSALMWRRAEPLPEDHSAHFVVRNMQELVRLLIP